MNLDKFIGCKISLLDMHDSRMDIWKSRWGNSCNWGSYDQIEMNEEELNNLVEPLSGMSYTGSELILKPALPEFTLRILGGEKGQETIICFRKTVLPPSRSVKDKTKGLTQVYSPLIDAYVFINNKGDRADAVITLGTLKVLHGGKNITGTFNKSVWISITNPFIDLFVSNSQEVLEFERGIKLAYLAIQKALYDRPTIFTKNIKQMSSSHVSNNQKKKKKKRNVVKAVRIIKIDENEMKKLVDELKTTKRTINCPSWGVMGHWRNYKTGKRTWVQPYRKGKDRHKEGAYTPKEYRFLEEGME
jgi:hypothetical protein